MEDLLLVLTVLEVMGMLTVFSQGFARETTPKSWTVIVHTTYILHMACCICPLIQNNSREKT